MRKENVLLFAIITMLLFGCKKNNTSKTPSSPKSSWIIEGVTYKGYASYSKNLIDNSLAAFTNINSNGFPSGNYVQVIFDYTAGKPATSATYTISNASVVPPNSTECLIYVGNAQCCWRYFSNKAGENVSLTVSSTGKLTASFSNITITNSVDSNKTVSGTLVEQ